MAEQAVDTGRSVTASGAGRRGAGRAGVPAAAAPPAPAAFAGRRRELAALRSDIERAGLDTLSGRKGARSRVLLIAGRPGSGRSALAAELARQLAGDYPDGVLRSWLSTADGRPVPTADVARDLLTRLGERVPAGADEDELTEALRAALADRRALLLLDDATGPEQVEPLLPDAPDCLVLAVSAGPLTGITDVRPCTLGGLDTAAGVEILTRYAGPTRITVDPRTADQVVQDCGGQPAALVLAGGWLAAHPKSSLTDLRRTLFLLPPGEEEAAPVPRPLARAFRLAYESLPPPAARILRLLSLAPAGLVDAHTASALAGCSVVDAEATLRDFGARGLLRPVQPAEGPVSGGPDAMAGLPAQYRVPNCLAPLLREQVRAHERPQEIQLSRARMLERTVRQLQSCRAMGEPAGSPARERTSGLPRSLRFGSVPEAAAWLRSRRPALLDSARIAVADGELDTLDRRLMAALVRALLAHEAPEKAAPDLYGLHGLVLEVAERRGLARERAAALLNLGDLDAEAGRAEKALARYRGALESARAVKDPVATGRALESLGGTYAELGDWQRAADWYGRALELRLSRGDTAEAARLHGRLGAVHTYAGRWAEALREWRAAYGAYRRADDAVGLARAMGETARVQEYAGRPEQALRTCFEALELARKAADGRLEAALQLRIADTFERLGDPAAARLHRGLGERLLADHPA
ncbi:tetratricopeptide repeat protein [Streptomyces violens]|uniref:tetratricopeptide repeat protein n=1 Tax=Streptomyces violens TaxID=66377 RepID=UPI0004C0701F|nr:tetratricopeptide repeat protein [Streptomyces violens]